MSENIDVLAVLRKIAYGYVDAEVLAMRVYADISELIAAANLAHEWIHEAGIRHRDMPNTATLSRLSCALSKVRGSA